MSEKVKPSNLNSIESFLTCEVRAPIWFVSEMYLNSFKFVHEHLVTSPCSRRYVWRPLSGYGFRHTSHRGENCTYRVPYANLASTNYRPRGRCLMPEGTFEPYTGDSTMPRDIIPSEVHILSTAQSWFVHPWWVTCTSWPDGRHRGRTLLNRFT